MSSYNFSLTDLDSDMFSCGYFLHEDVCRFCWTRDATIDIFPKNTQSEKETPLSVKILSCLDIDINTLCHPKRVCDACAKHIETFYSFKKFCIESHKKLNKLFKKRIPYFDVTIKIEDVNNEEHVIQNENCSEEQAIQNKNCSEEHEILNENSSEDHVIQNDNCSEEHVIQNDNCSEDHVIQNDNCSEEHVIQNDKCSEEHVIQNDKCSEEHVIQNDNWSEEHVIQNEICLEEIVQNRQTQREENYIQEDHTYSLSHNQHEDNLESDDTSITSENQISQGIKQSSNNDSFVDVETVSNNITVENIVEEEQIEEDTKPKQTEDIGEIEQEMNSLDRLLSNSLSHNQHEDNLESDDTSITSKNQISQEKRQSSNNDSFVDIETVSNNITVENVETLAVYANVEEEQVEEDIKPKQTEDIGEIEQEMDSLDRLLSKIHGEYTSDCEIIAKEIDSMEIETEKVRPKRKQSKTSKKENIKVESTPKHPKKCSKNEETQPNALKEFCKTCGKDFKNIFELAKHNKKVHKIKDDGKSYMCYGCDKSFANKKRRFNHELRYCKGVQDGYKCPKCDRYLQFRKLLERHIKDHNLNKGVNLPEILFICKICKKPFQTKEKLRLHRSINHPLKKYVCETCGRVFRRTDYLAKHKLLHTDIRDHRCPHCPYSTVQRSSLVIHIRTHTGDKPYACDQCPQRCVTKSNLTVHKRRHGGKPTHQCQQCERKFAFKSSLVYHITHSHAKQGDFICHHCDAIFTTKLRLARHIGQKHRERDKHLTNDMADNSKMQIEDELFNIQHLPAILQNVDYGEFSKFEEGFNEKIGYRI